MEPRFSGTRCDGECHPHVDGSRFEISGGHDEHLASRSSLNLVENVLTSSVKGPL